MLLYQASAVIFIYLIWRLVRPLSAARRTKLVLALAVLAIAPLPAYQRIFWGRPGAAELPLPVLVAANWLFFTLAFLCALLMARDFILLALRLAGRPGDKIRRAGASRAGALALTALAGVIAACGLWQGVKTPEVRYLEAAAPSLPPGLDGLTLVQISDLHASPMLKGPRVRRIVEKTNALKPDIIVLTGDMVDGPVERRAEDVAPLADLKAALGVFACVGNHEYYSGFDRWLAAFESLGLNVLLNRHVVLEKNGARLILAGITDRAARGRGKPYPDAVAAFDGAPDGLVKILLAHRPTQVAAEQLAGVDLQLSGHTHGGQLFFVGWKGRELGGGYLSGWHEIGERRMYVSTGAGLWNGFPIRLGVPSEIVCLKLRAGSPPLP